jgi:hypothetical protein
MLLTLTAFTKSISQLRVQTRQLVAGVAGEGPPALKVSCGISSAERSGVA